MRSPGLAGVAKREDWRRFWLAIASGRAGTRGCGAGWQGLPNGGIAVVPGGRRHATATSRAKSATACQKRRRAPTAPPPSGRHLSFAKREEIARLAGARPRSTRDRPLPGIGRARRSRGTFEGMRPHVRAVRRSAPPRRNGMRNGPAGNPKPVTQSRRSSSNTRYCVAMERIGSQAGLHDLTGRTCLARRRREPGDGRSRVRPDEGAGLEPRTDPGQAPRERSRDRNDAYPSRSHLSGALHARPQWAAPRVESLPAEREGPARPPGPGHPGPGQAVRPARDHDWQVPGGGSRPGCAGPSGRRPEPRPERLRDRHAGRPHDPRHEARTSSTHARSPRRTAR